MPRPNVYRGRQIIKDCRGVATPASAALPPRRPPLAAQSQRFFCKLIFANYSNGVESPETQLPNWIDPTRDLILTPNRLKGLNHPIRLRLLELLQQDGPATATSLAARTGQSSGVTSYHLRVLNEHQFIVEDTERGNARDRFWRAPHRSMGFTLRMTDDPGSSENIGETEQYLRIVANEIHRRVVTGIDQFTAHPDDMVAAPWQLNDFPLRLTVEEAKALTEQINTLVQRFRRPPGDPDPKRGTIRAYFQFQLLPDEAGDLDEPADLPESTGRGESPG
jgi:DNA-binding transcriptional ArsR family regulator